MFLDPPYDFEPYGDLLHLLFGLGLAGDDTLVVIEHRAKKALAAEGPGFRLLRRIRQGEKCLSFFRRERSAVGEGNPTT